LEKLSGRRQMMRREQVSIMWWLALLVGFPAAGLAQGTHSGGRAPRQEAVVLAVTNGEILTDLGTSHGLAEGMEGLILNQLELTHPITGARVSDLVPLAPATVLHAGEIVSAVVVDKALLARVQQGDVVRFTKLIPPPDSAANCPVCAECLTDEDALEVQAIWATLSGKNFVTRERAWNELLERSPTNKYRPQIESELLRLDGLRNTLREAASARKREAARDQRTKAEREEIIIAYHSPLKRVNEGTPVRLVAFVLADAAIEGVRFHLRQRGETYYTFLPMEPFGDSHYRVVLSADQVQFPGLEYYIDARDERARRIPVFGLSGSPQSLEVVRPVPKVNRTTDRSSARFHVEWADFFLKSAGSDFFWKAEGDFAYRLHFGPFYSFRMGFGIFEGVGGPAKELEAVPAAALSAGTTESPEQLTLTYSYFEPELELGKYVHLIPRLVVGAIREKKVANSDNLHRGESIFGFHTYLRLGEEQGTNLLMGGSLTQELGLEALVTMNLAVFEHFPVGVSVAATNLPVGEDYAARLALQLGWRQYDWMSIDALLGVNMRNIRHVGMGGGLGLSFNW